MDKGDENCLQSMFQVILFILVAENGNEYLYSSKGQERMPNTVP